MEVAASIVGLLTAASQVYITLNAFLSSCRDAPIIAQTTRDEIRDFRYALLQLRDCVWQNKNITPLGRATTDTSQLILTLASSMTTLAQVEKTLDPLLSQSKMDYIRRIRWGLADSDLAKLLTRIQSHKLTLNLLLTIWLSQSAAQAEASNDLLNDTLKDLLDPRYRRPPQPLDPSIDNVLHGGSSGDISHTLILVNQGASTTAGGETASLMTVKKPFSVISGKSLRSKLRNTKPYAGTKAFDSSAQSVLTSQRATPWSEFTIGSDASVFSLPFSRLDLDTKRISEVKEIHRISLPIDGMTFYNDWRYPGGNIPPELPEVGLCILLSIFGLKPKIRRDGMNESRDLPAFSHYNKKSPLIARELSKKLSRYPRVSRIYSSFLRDKLDLAISNNDLHLVGLLLSWSAQKRFGVWIGTELVEAFKNAIRRGNSHIVELFLEWGAHIEVQQKEPEHSIIDLVLESRRNRIIELFLLYGLDTEKGYGNPPCTPLQVAAMGRYSDSVGVARCLLHLGADIEGFCKERPQTPLELAVNSGKGEMIQFLLLRGANASKTYGNPPRTPLQAAAMGTYSNSVGIARCLLARGVSIEGCCKEERRTPLELAVDCENYEMIQFLLLRGANAEKAYGKLPWTLLQAATMGRYPDSVGIAHCLLHQGADIEECSEQERRTPLQIAVDNRDHEMVKLLVGLGADIDARYAESAHTPIGKVIGYGDLDMFNTLLGRHVEMEYCSPGRTLLQIIVEMQPPNSVGMARRLLASGAKIDGYTYEEPRTPLQIAVGIDDKKMALFLIAHGANIEGCSARALKTPLQMAVEKQSKEMVSILLNGGARPHGCTPGYQCPMHMAVVAGSEELVGLLSIKGVNPSEVCYQDTTD